MERFKLLNPDSLKSIRGGKREVVKYDIDGDGKWDVKTITNKKRGKFKAKIRAN